MIKIGASLLSADFSRLGTEAKRAEKGGADFLHFDIMNGHFVPNITFGPTTVKALRNKTSLPFYVHLMIQNPDKYIEKFAEVGSNLLTVHAETYPNLERILDQIRQQGVKAGVALNPKTPLSSVETALDKIDLLLIMTVEPGFGGQPFLPATLPKIKEAREKARKRRINLEIGVDGGINEETAPLAVEAGANTLIAGSAIYGAKNIKRAIQRLRKSAQSAKAKGKENLLEDIIKELDENLPSEEESGNLIEASREK